MLTEQDQQRLPQDVTSEVKAEGRRQQAEDRGRQHPGKKKSISKGPEAW